ncbi:MAG: hypothetical protein WC661_10235 [Opitutaceae bacterium]|jgi:hypothetical protein
MISKANANRVGLASVEDLADVGTALANANSALTIANAAAVSADVKTLRRLLSEAVVLNDLTATFTRASSAYDPEKGVVVGNNVRRRKNLSPFAGLVINADLIEHSQTNRILYSDDLTNAAWVSTGITVTANAYPAPSPGGQLVASRLTATAANATLIQAVTNGDQPRRISVWMRRVTGVGAVSINIGGTLQAVALTSDWKQFQTGAWWGAGANLSFGFKIATSGDVVDVWAPNYNEYNYSTDSDAGITSYLPTTSAAVSRNADVLDVSLSSLPGGGLNRREGTLLALYENGAFVHNNLFFADTVGGAANRWTLYYTGGFFAAHPYAAGASQNQRAISSTGNMRSPWGRNYILDSWNVGNVSTAAGQAATSRYGVTYAAGNAASSVQAGAPTEFYDALTSVRVGSKYDGNQALDGYVALLYWPRALSATEFDTLRLNLF